nr:ribonuclease H-like domain-containing protein [Tanacetum cinerariifolium]
MEEQFECFIEYYHENYPEDYKSDLENFKEVYKIMNDGVEYPRTQNASPSKIKEPCEPSPRMYSYEEPSCLGSTFVDGEPICNLDTMEDKAKNPSPQSTPHVLPSFEVYTPAVTHPEEVEETLGIPMEVEPLDHMKLEDLGLNTNTRDLFLSFKGFSSVDEPEP